MVEQVPVVVSRQMLLIIPKMNDDISNKIQHICIYIGKTSNLSPNIQIVYLNCRMSPVL